jgi:carbon storage regulator CsrA
MELVKKDSHGHLLLTRQAGESIKIGGNITIYVDQVKGSRVRIGIIAPLEIAVVRDDAVKLRPPTTADKMD